MIQTSTKPNTNITISTSTNQINFNTTEKNGISANTSAISSNYNSLINKPSINGVSLSGDLNSVNLRIIDDATISALSTYSSEKILEEMKKVIVVNELIGTEENPLIASDLKIGSYAFSGCTKLALTSLPDNIRNIGSYAFNNCKNLALTSLPQNLLYINNSVFNKCRSLKITELPVSCTKIYSYGLSGCTGITELTLPETFTRLYNAALSDCTNLTTLKILASTPPEIDSTTAFRNCPKLTRIEVPSASLEAYKTAKIWSNYANIMVGV